ncbi:MAG: SusC/RagA family TonB-linked outer membrane protein [Gemmatimonadaceae bacterium]|nr:SusC/RagA family TonB-linked outer membrane protein [Gemmatimonadaceae bacterium]NUO93672.1 SusC/RagA family TonB-linked outer membrane protein [Gemmatimonadaceae bacterium]NUP57458.1 SusC/RagA family TonB-linked outer membrane protein [Gemmatimonadaceae bacterium]NUS33861.1 SusC/RagA family TonB-linked outer membrane protein [Gemmatimonadaceae bacterium]NUS47315.1 SusC/RagA family TonB-linked outer membrane protein [Gemmatimonadaceae bacterium]
MSQARIRPPSRPAARARLTARRWLAWPAALMALLALAPGVALAQTGIVSGTVVAEGSLRPLANVQVTVEGQPGRGAVTDAGGRFRLAGLSGSTVTLVTRLLGFRQSSRTVQVGATDVRFVLAERAVELNQVVVTGTAGGEQKRAIGTSVAQVNAAEVTSKTAVASVDALLNGRAAGVAILPGTGMIGAGARVRIRGIGSFSLSADPLIYVDGVRVNNQTGTGISIQAFSSGVISRLNDFDPEQIESIEVLKGPAAATLYGTEAARGVINIITKKGVAGQTTYDFMVRAGGNTFQNAAGRIATNWCHIQGPTSCLPNGTGPLLGLNTVVRQDSLGAPIFRTGRVLDYNASVSGGTGILRFYASGGVDDEQGADPSNEQRKNNFRTNLTITPNERLNVSTNFGYVDGRIRTACEAGCGGLMWDSEYSTPANLPQFCDPGDIPCTWVQGFNGTPPAADLVLEDWQNLNRITASATISYDPFKWLSTRAAIGTDVTQEGNIEYVPYLTNDTLASFWGANAKGYRYNQQHQATYNTYDLNGSAHFDLPRQWTTKTSAGLQYYTNHHNYISGEGDFFPAPGLQTIGSASTIQPSFDNWTQNNTFGFFGQQEFAFAERLYLTGAARVDNNSAFGSEVHWVTYPKLSASYVVSEEPRFQRMMPSWLSSLRLRAAYGASGQQPALNTALRTLTPAVGPNSSGVLSPNTLGNPELKPERVLGTELGFETGLLNDRLGIDFTYFRDRSKDAILSRGVAPGTGFGASTQFFNAGEITKHGIEALIKMQLVNHTSWGWDSNINLATTHAKISRLAGTDTVIDNGFNAHRVGYQPFDWFTQKVVRVDQGPGATQASYNPATNKWTIPKSSVYCATPSGGETPCYNANGSVIAPKIYRGHSSPTFEGSWSNTVRFLTNFRLYAMLDAVSGFKRLDNNIRIRCQIFHTCLEYVQPQNTDPILLAQYFSGGPLRDFTINDARYVKFRELSLSYDASSWLAARAGAKTLSVTASARNIHTWSPYSGMDPESQFVTNATGGTPALVDQAHLPQLLNYSLTFHLSY